MQYILLPFRLRPVYEVETAPRLVRSQEQSGIGSPSARQTGFTQIGRSAIRQETSCGERRTARCKTEGTTRSSMQPHPLHPALPRPSTKCAWSSGRNHGALLRTYISNAPGARETAFSSSSLAPLRGQAGPAPPRTSGRSSENWDTTGSDVLLPRAKPRIRRRNINRRQCATSGLPDRERGDRA